MKRHPFRCLLSAAVSASACASVVDEPAKAELVRPGRCRMDYCYESLFLGKKLILSNDYGVLYEVKERQRGWRTKNYDAPRPSISSVPYGPVKTSFVLCSTKRPSVIFKPDDSSAFIVHRLNPDGNSYSSYNLDSYQDYWHVCHNLAGPDYFSPEMVSRSIQLGYPGNLVEDQIEVSHPLDLMR